MMSGKIRLNIPVVFIVLLLMPQSLVLADLAIVNGDFSAGLSGWSVDPFGGDVVDGGGYALFVEDPDLMLSSLSQEFIIPALALELSFDVAMTTEQGGYYDEWAWPDAFAATLYDNSVDLNPLISIPSFNEFLYMDNTGFVDDTVATFDGTTVSLDVSSVAGENVFLAFDLFGSDDGKLTSVSIYKVDISLVPAPGALLLGIIGTGMVGLWRRFKKSA